VAHGPAVAPACGEELALVDAEVVLEHGHELVSEGNVFTTAVGPAGVQAVGGNEDGAVTGEGPQAVEAAASNVVHGPITPVVSKDNTVGFAGVIVVGKLENVLPLLAVNVNGLSARRRGVLATAGRGRLDGLSRRQKG
jgi:hypothetical protein